MNFSLSDALKYAAKPKATTADYHKAFDAVAGDHTGSFSAKAELPVQFYGDHLRSEGHHPQADFVDSSLQGTKELGEPAVVKVDTAKFPEKHREQFEALEPGDFYLHLDRPQGEETHAVLFQKSHTQPNTAYGFLDSIKGTPDEVKAEVDRFHQAGVPVDLGRTVDPQSEDYDLWQKHFGLHKTGEQEPEFGAEEPEEYRSPERRLKYINETHSDFHNRILENPAETTPALVYADWLEEQGKPAHAELIRRSVNHFGDAASIQHRGTEYLPNTPFHPHQTTADLWDAGEGRAVVNLFQATDRPETGFGWAANFDTKEEAAKAHSDLLKEGALPHNHRIRVGYHQPPIVGRIEEPQEAVSEHFTTADHPVRYSAVPEFEYHPDYAPNGVAPRVGHLLSQLATEDSDAGALAEGILRTGSHDILPILADRLQETDHPLAQEIDWRHAPRAIRIDRSLHREIGKRQVRHPDGHRVPLTAAWVLADMQEGIRRPAFSKRKALLITKLAQPDATSEDVAHSLFRLMYDRAAQEEGLLGQQIPPHQKELTKARLQRLGHRPSDPFRYTDLRPEQNRKYAAYKAPAGGMVVKQSPLAVSGQWAEGGEFVNDLQKLPTGTAAVDYKKKRKRKKHLVVEYLRKRFRSRVVPAGTATEDEVVDGGGTE